MDAADTLTLIRDYEGQIALLKLRIEHLEQTERQLRDSIRVLTSQPEELLQKLTIVGFPAIDVKDIYDLLDEWHRLGGGPEILEGWRQARAA